MNTLKFSISGVWLPFFAFFFFSGSLLAQGTVKVKKDVVYLKDGNVLVGDIEELFPDSIVKIRVDGGSFFVLHWSDISKIAKEDREVVKPQAENQAESEKPPVKSRKRDQGPFVYAPKGYVPSFHTAWLMGNNGNGGRLGLSVQSLHNITLKHYFSPGILLGLDRYDSEFSIFSPMLNIRGDVF